MFFNKIFFIIFLVCVDLVMIKSKTYNQITFNEETINQISEYSFKQVVSSPYSFSSKIKPLEDLELSTFFKNTVLMFNYQIQIIHENKVISSALITDGQNIFKLTYFDYHIHNVPTEHKFTMYQLLVNNKFVYKFSDITMVQLYFETINQKFTVSKL